MRMGSDLLYRSLGFLFILLGCLKFGFSFASELNRVFVGHKNVITVSALWKWLHGNARGPGCGRWGFPRPANHRGLRKFLRVQGEVGTGRLCVRLLPPFYR